MTRRRKCVSLLLVGVALFFAMGCAANTKTVKTETTRYPGTAQPTVVERETTVTTEAGEPSGGIVSGTVDVVGEVVALPFRAVGGLIRTIF
ncbi:MAG: hypothetical protein AB7G75_10345 [Candidatus Binatia bacterium]